MFDRGICGELVLQTAKSCTVLSNPSFGCENHAVLRENFGPKIWRGQRSLDVNARRAMRHIRRKKCRRLEGIVGEEQECSNLLRRLPSCAGIIQIFAQLRSGIWSLERHVVAYSMLASGPYAVLGENSSQSDQTGK